MKSNTIEKSSVTNEAPNARLLLNLLGATSLSMEALPGEITALNVGSLMPNRDEQQELAEYLSNVDPSSADPRAVADALLLDT